MSMRVFDVAVVGAGPAGLTTAVNAAEHGLSVVLIDAGTQPGGQYWRHPDEQHGVARPHGQHGWREFMALRARLDAQRDAGRIDLRTATQVWLIERPTASNPAWTLRMTPVTGDGSGDVVRATRIVLAPGGHDRQLPIPGWDLPGVMAAGGVQALLKGNGTLAGKRVIVAGTGPFLLPVAAGLADAGATVVSICEANTLTGWVRQLRGAVRVPAKAIEGAGYAAALVRHRIPYRQRTVISYIDGDDAVRKVTTSRLTADGQLAPGTDLQDDVDLVALGWGFTPSMELVLATGADTRLGADDSLVAIVDPMQRSTAAGVYVAGEATGVGGAALAVAEGELAALAVARDAAQPIDDNRVRTLQRRIRRLRAFANAMHRAHPIPPRWQEWLTDKTIVCRCEEVSYGDLRQASTVLGAQDARTLKLLARPGMGWCQGRICGAAVARIAAELDGRALDARDLLPLAKRSIAAPVTLADIANAIVEEDS